MKQALRRPLAIVLAVALLFSCLILPVGAEGERIGVIYGLDTNLRVRTSPGGTERLTYQGNNVNLYSGDEVTVLEEVNVDNVDHPKWYKISFDYSDTVLTGYVSATYVRIKEQLGEITQDFEEMIAQFPESYREALRELHLYYPEWSFVPLNVNLDWSYVIDHEAVPDSNYVHTTDPESWRSTGAGSYDWTTDTWVLKSAGSRYDASREIVEYYMDPRNFLDEKYIFQFESLSYNEQLHTLEGIEKMVNSINFMKGKTIKNSAGEDISYAQAYLDAAKATNVSPFHLVARTRQEVGTNGSSATSGTVSGYQGIYNFYNIGANRNVTDGLAWASGSGSYGRPWNSQYKSIVGGGEFIGKGYINNGQNTLYLEKFDVVGDDKFNHQYMQTISAPTSEASTIYNTYQTMGVLNSAFCFIIPVYNNMPETKCEKPTRTGSPNNWLKSLEVEGYSLTPTFVCDGSTNYELVVDESVESVKIKAVAVSDQANITDGSQRTVELASGSNRVKIKVAAGNGDIKTYVIIIVRGEATELPPDEEDSEENGYDISYTVKDGRISGITLGTKLTQVKNHLGLKGSATAAFFGADGAAITNMDTVASTGMTVKITCGTTDIYTLLIYGDANGDGEVNAIDFLMIKRSILGTYTLKNVYFNAADCNKDGQVDAVDFLMVRRHILGTYTIQQ